MFCFELWLPANSWLVVLQLPLICQTTRAAIRAFRLWVHLPEGCRFSSELRAALQAAYYLLQRYGAAEVNA